MRDVQAVAGTREGLARQDALGERLQVERVPPGLHEKAEGVPGHSVYRLTWPERASGRRGPAGLLGRRAPSGRYVRVGIRPPGLPRELLRRLRALEDAAGAEAVALFIDTELRATRLEAVAAARVAREWRQLYRWETSWNGLGISRLDVCRV